MKEARENTDCSNNEGKQFTIMDRNLGDWEQPEGSYSTYDGLKYQWGNPDDTAPVKTIYDPCPKGYMVAPAEVFTGFTVDGQNAFSSSSILTEGYFEDGFAFTNASSFFPAAGQLANNSGVLRLVPGPSGREGYYWTSSVGENGDSRMVDFNKNMLLYNTNKRASGCSVRCVRVL